METSITKYDWKYCTERMEREREIEFKIIPPEKTDAPSLLYKFYSLTHNGIDALLNSYIYATHPSQFNDLFDCYENLIIFDIPELINKFLTEALGKDKAEELIKEDNGGLETFVQRNFREIIYRKWGVVCLTANPNNTLMWSYYTNNQGFSIGFDYSKFEFKYMGPFPVNYQDEIKPLSLKESSVELAALYQTNIKHSGWKHEMEWRLLINSPEEGMISPNFEILKKLGGHNRKFPYPITAIKHICLGNRFFLPDELHEVNGSVLEVNLKDNFEQKCAFLSFLIENKIESYLALRNGDFKSIEFRKGVFERKSANQFYFTAI